ncbi:MAG TPA: iron-containing redox enzyme family protein [Arenibaculum sp.]|nr:iron-containing redox enzyme family protein [Arenibaculum sp.]
MDIGSVIAHCDSIIKTKRYSRHPFVVDFERNRPDEATLGRWALQKYHQTYSQNRIFSVIHAKTDFADVRHFMMEQLIAEETSITSGSDSHYNLMRRFAEACGVPADQFSEHTMAPEVRAYVDTLVSIMRDEHFTVALLTIYSIESQSGESAGKLLAALRKHYRFSDAELEWFSVHSEDEDTHADDGLQLVKKYAHLLADFDQAAPRAVTRICDAWLALHDFYASLLGKGCSLEAAAN